MGCLQLEAAYPSLQSKALGIALQLSPIQALGHERFVPTLILSAHKPTSQLDSLANFRRVVAELLHRCKRTTLLT